MTQKKTQKKKTTSNRKGIGGRPPKPKAQKLLEGTYRKDRDKSVGVVLPILLPSKPPPQLTTKNEKLLWQTVINPICKLGYLVPGDLPLAAAYCQQMGFYFDFISIMKGKTKAGGVTVGDGWDKKPAALWKMSQEALKAANSIAAKFGLSPSDRARIVMSPPGDEEKKKDDFDEI